eukprot:Tbor_TRINITY_DN5295_c0_g1::TRINITY_DN5295_c0_g1_i1::g.16003::m.16003
MDNLSFADHDLVNTTSSDIGLVKGLKELHTMYKEGILTLEEFTLAKQRMLSPSNTHSSASTAKSAHHEGRRRGHTRRSRRSSSSSKSSRSSSSSSSSSSSNEGFMINPRVGIWNPCSLDNAVRLEGSIDESSIHVERGSEDYSDEIWSDTKENMVYRTTDLYSSLRSDDLIEVITGKSVTAGIDDGTLKPIPSHTYLYDTSASLNISKPTGVPRRQIRIIENSAGNSAGMSNKKRVNDDNDTHDTALLINKPKKNIWQKSFFRNKKKIENSTGLIPYGTFVNADYDHNTSNGSQRSKRKKSIIKLSDENTVTMFYFNSKGKKSSVSFADIQLKPEDLRDDVDKLNKDTLKAFQEKQQLYPSVVPTVMTKALGDNKPQKKALVSQAEFSSEIGSGNSLIDDTMNMSPTSPNKRDKRLLSLNTNAPAEGIHNENLVKRSKSKDSSKNISSLSSVSTQSSKEIHHYDWYWIDMVGRDEGNSRSDYNRKLHELTDNFRLCPSLLIERGHTIALPQFFEASSNPKQFLVVLRVANPQVSMTDDNAMELTNRWMLVVDLGQKLVITIHRADTISMVRLRETWDNVMRASDVSFQEFLVKILHDALDTFHYALKIHADALDFCEGKLMFSASANEEYWRQKNKKDTNYIKAEQVRQSKERIIKHFSGARESKFINTIAQRGKNINIDKGEMNLFLYHMHRRSHVQHRILMQTQEVLITTYYRLRLCSKEYAKQMTQYGTELANRALEIREDSHNQLEMHISLVSFRTNELMGLLTRFDIVFGPATFIAGVYGMNFHNIPEYSWQYGYAFFWVLTVFCTIFVYITFLRKS